MLVNFLPITQKIRDITTKSYSKRRKDDGSWVTDIDHELDSTIRNFLEPYKVRIYSEEIAFSEIQFPCFIVDPLDGTRDFINNSDDYSISIAYANSERIDDPESWGWIYHPPTNTIYDSLSNGKGANHLCEILVSRSEDKAGEHEKLKQQHSVLAIGSICLKLGMLAAGKAAAVVSVRPKSVWDIAAGSILLSKQGYLFLENGKSINKIENRRYGKNLVWIKNGKENDIIKMMEGNNRT